MSLTAFSSRFIETCRTPSEEAEPNSQQLPRRWPADPELYLPSPDRSPERLLLSDENPRRLPRVSGSALSSSIGSLRINGNLVNGVNSHVQIRFDGVNNDRAAGTRVPNENYAREILQLFSIGLSELNADGTPVLDSAGVPVPTRSRVIVPVAGPGRGPVQAVSAALEATSRTASRQAGFIGSPACESSCALES